MYMKAYVPILMMALTLAFPLSMGTLKYVPIYKVVNVRANKKLPPHIAYLDTHFEMQGTDWVTFEKSAKRPLLSGPTLGAQQGPYVLTSKRDLPGLTIKKNTEILVAANGLKTEMQAIQENQGPTWLKNLNPPKDTKAWLDTSLSNLQASRRITGPIEITGGLAVTNEYHIEVRRTDDGVFQEMGRVDLQRGSYSIDVDEASGAIVASLIDRSGQILGEGSVRLAELASGASRLIVGPKLEVAPRPALQGTVGSYYSSGSGGGGAHPTIAKADLSALNGAVNMKTDKSSSYRMENLAQNSSTVLRANAPGFVNTSRLMVATPEKFSMTMFPDSMISSLKSIVADQKQTMPEDLENSSVVWGTVSLDGKAMSGASVECETQPDAKPIYFNEFMIPDPKLTATSSNGLYAFVGLQPGFHALLAQRGGAYFAHQNVVAEENTVAIGDLQNTLHTEPAKLRVFDAFNGDSVATTVHMQSLATPVEVGDDAATVILPQIPRLSMLYVETQAPYLATNYFYSDTDSYIHVPLLRADWLAEVKAQSKVSDEPLRGTIVGFFPHENFEVYLASATKVQNFNVVYFDAAGRITSDRTGTAGGGFVIFNAPLGTQEVVLVGSGSERIYSKVVPVDAESVSVLGFNPY